MNDETKPDASHDGDPLRVLLIEDSAPDAELALYELRRQGLHFISKRVWQEPELVEALRTFAPNIILSDYSMPNMNGLRAFQITRELARDIPFIFLSGTIGEERAIEALTSGAVDYILKSNLARLGPAVARAVREVSERKEYEQRIRYLANFDDLTGLPNRTLLQDRAVQAILHCRRSNAVLTLAVVDIDRFTLVNEGFGRAVGDQLLQEVASRIRSTVSESDTVVRLSADVFVVLSVESARADDSLVLANGIIETINETIAIQGRELQVGATIGIALFPRDGDDLDTLLRNAESALHRAKQQSRGGVQFYNSQMTDEAIERIENEANVRSALRRGELTLNYQPQFEVQSRRIIGVEALLRWNHPTRGLLPLGQLISIAEEIGAIHAIGTWVLEEACTQAMTWIREGYEPIRMSVNVSTFQLQANGFVETVERILHSSGLPPTQLELEITESALMADVKESAHVLTRLKALGLSIAIDDFGTGYSSLSYLSRFPIDHLKIDRSFIAQMMEDPHDYEIVLAVLSLAKVLGMSVIAEGVETEAQLARLAANNCPEAQGYLVSRPLVADKVSAFLVARSAK
ncbi:MAG TPA: GGDEF domain-containing response regulator [Rhodocyclaceae bacterium]|nr:GGDEF domain-containing response regulator [Rhodocyclaceae bacterium]